MKELNGQAKLLRMGPGAWKNLRAQKTAFNTSKNHLNELNMAFACSDEGFEAKALPKPKAKETTAEEAAAKAEAKAEKKRAYDRARRQRARERPGYREERKAYDAKRRLLPGYCEKKKAWNQKYHQNDVEKNARSCKKWRQNNVEKIAA